MKAAEKTAFWVEFINSRVVHHAGTDERDVRLMAVVQCWAMVRRPRAMPYVCHIDELKLRPGASV